MRTFLLSNALYWLREFHIDGLRVDAVASMLYLDYSREPGEWIPNRYGGRENLEAIDFLRRFNELAHQEPGAHHHRRRIHRLARRLAAGLLDGLGFTMKWNMGWMHDMFDYFAKDPVFRKYHQQNITFSMLYAFTENFVLPVSHDEVVHCKRSPGFENARRRVAALRQHPRVPGLHVRASRQEAAVHGHANSARPRSGITTRSLPWRLLQWPVHHKLQTMVKELNWLYRREPALYEVDDNFTGFEWIDFRDAESSIISFVRFAQGSRGFHRVRVQFHAGAAIRLSHRRAARGPVSRNFQHRRCDVRRLEHGQRRLRR